MEAQTKPLDTARWRQLVDDTLLKHGDWDDSTTCVPCGAYALKDEPSVVHEPGCSLAPLVHGWTDKARKLHLEHGRCCEEPTPELPTVELTPTDAGLAIAAGDGWSIRARYGRLSALVTVHVGGRQAGAAEVTTGTDGALLRVAQATATEILHRALLARPAQQRDGQAASGPALRSIPCGVTP